jgi:hypothetical protein
MGGNHAAEPEERTMIISARYEGTCGRCGGHIAVGAQIDWVRGGKPSHAKCPKAGASSSKPAPQPRAPKPTTPSVSDAPYVRHEKWEPCKRADLPDTTGAVRVAGQTKRPWADLRKGAQGEAAREGDAFVVVGQVSRYESAEDSEDMGDMSGAGWCVTLYLRRAEIEEARKAVAAYLAGKLHTEQEKQLEAAKRELSALCRAGWTGCDDDARKPAGQEVEIRPGVHGSGREVAVLSEDGQGVALYCGGHYDDYRPTLAVTREPRAAEILRSLLGAAS